MVKTIGIILLAAGASTRLGTSKQLLNFKGKPLLLHVTEQALGSVCRPVVVVLGARYALHHPVIAHLPISIIENPDWEQGMSRSIQCGLQAIADVEAVIVSVCDQPFIKSEHFDALSETFQHTGSPVIASAYAHTVGTPVLFAKTTFPSLMVLAGKLGAKSLITDKVHSVPFPLGHWDIDTPVDVQRLQEIGLDINL
jgi:molybdenum cofactor cytidylyltransferase